MSSSTELRVKELLKSKGWTTKVLSEKTGISESYLTHIKNGTRRWNEDSLRKIADALEMEPISLLVGYKGKSESLVISYDKHNKDKKIDIQANKNIVDPKKILEKINVSKVPMMNTIPSYPSLYNNSSTQLTSGYKDMFVPVINVSDDSMFCFVVDNYSMSPKLQRGDCVIISPSTKVMSGDLAAVEYCSDKTHKGLMYINYTKDFIMLESVNHKQPPVALLKSRDFIRVIGKAILIYQKLL